jgi:hypothetical protein
MLASTVTSSPPVPLTVLPNLGFPGVSAAWTRDGSRAYWLEAIGDGGASALAAVSVAGGAPGVIDTDSPLPIGSPSPEKVVALARFASQKDELRAYDLAKMPAARTTLATAVDENVAITPDGCSLVYTTTVDFDPKSPRNPPGILVSACGESDLPCATPLATGTTDDAGTVGLHLPNAGDGFHGYLDVTGPSFTEQLVYFSHPVTSGNLTVLAGDSLVYQYVFPSGTTTRGRLWIIAEGCVGTPAFGASFAISNADPQTVYEVYAGLTTIADADIFPPTQWVTGSSLVAYGFADNAPTGPTTVTTTYAGQPVGSMHVYLRAGAVVQAVLAPTP